MPYWGRGVLPYSYYVYLRQINFSEKKEVVNEFGGVVCVL